jgi:thiosulfate dehydrogenase [quinone] large subunit
MKNSTATTAQVNGLLILRLFIGWHFLYEGVLKLYNPGWTSKGYLLSATFLKPLFAWLAQESLISVADTLNIVGLVAIGAGLLLGFRIRWACIGGILLLALYYLAHPPFPGMEQGPSEGSYWIVNKNLVEMAALFVLYQFANATGFGIEHFFQGKKNQDVQPVTSKNQTPL